jgi:hypothetical protein
MIEFDPLYKIVWKTYVPFPNIKREKNVVFLQK